MSQPTAELFLQHRARLLDTLRNQVRQHPHIKAAWLEGSLGRHQADRFSDIDLHVLLDEADREAFKQQVQRWLADAEPLVLCNLLFGGHMVNALTESGVRLDLWTHAGESIALDPTRVLVLKEQPGSIVRTSTPPPDAAAQGRTVIALLQEFWRCISLLPAVIGRGEHLVAFGGLSVELNLVADLLLIGAGIVRDRGVKNLNAYLPAPFQQELEAALTLPDVSTKALVDAHLRLVTLVQREGRRIAERWSVHYPEALEATVWAYVQNELALQDAQEKEDKR